MQAVASITHHLFRPRIYFPACDYCCVRLRRLRRPSSVERSSPRRALLSRNGERRHRPLLRWAMMGNIGRLTPRGRQLFVIARYEWPRNRLIEADAGHTRYDGGFGRRHRRVRRDSFDYSNRATTLRFAFRPASLRRLAHQRRSIRRRHAPWACVFIC